MAAGDRAGTPHSSRLPRLRRAAAPGGLPAAETERKRVFALPEPSSARLLTEGRGQGRPPARFPPHAWGRPRSGAAEGRPLTGIDEGG